MARHRAPSRHRPFVATAAVLVLLVTGIAFYVLRASEQQARAGSPSAWLTEAQKGQFDKPRASDFPENRCVPVGPCPVWRP